MTEFTQALARRPVIASVREESAMALAAESSVAHRDFPITWNVILLMTPSGNRGSTRHCARTANVPMAITCASSFRKSASSDGAVNHPATARIVISKIPVFNEKKNASFTLR